jgi:hypothetical protein
MAARLLERALLMTHPSRGVLSFDRTLCLRLRLTTLTNLACAMRSNGKPNLGLRYASAALELLGHTNSVLEADEVCAPA